MVNIMKKGMIIGIIYLLFLGYLFLFCERIERLENDKNPLIYDRK